MMLGRAAPCLGHPGLQLLLTLGVILASLTYVSPKEYWDYIVIGAGPGGLQLGYYLQKAGRDYVLMERGAVPGNFYTTYPRHGKLISLNKRNTGRTNKEFNMRHDWNSLLSDDDSLQLRHYSKEMFPHKSVLLRYLDDYQKKSKINVQYGTEISGIERMYNSTVQDYYFKMQDQNDNVYKCRTLVIATGIWKPNIPDFPGANLTEGYETISVNPDDYEGKTVLIIGRGNSAFEVADAMYGATNAVHMLGRSRVRLSWETHYVGDLRAINNGLLDTYQLKSLDGVLEAPVEDMILTRTEEGRLQLSVKDEVDEEYDNFSMREHYDKVIRCLGFVFDESIFTNSTTVKMGRGRKKKYPKIHANYESTSVPGMFFAGTNTHSLDHRKSAGGFIHGFRYTSRTLFHLLEWRNHQVPWPHHTGATHNLLNVLIKRINEASGIYQMFSVLGDVIALSSDGTSYTYLETFPIDLLDRVEEVTGHPVGSVIVLVMQYGANFSGAGFDIFREDRATGEPSEAHESNFLHPVFYYYEHVPSNLDMEQRRPKTVLPRPDRIHHMVEDFLTTWDAPSSHILPLRRFIESVTNNDLRHFFAEDCLKMAMVFNELPTTCNEYFMKGSALTGTDQLLYAALKAGLVI